MSVSVDTRVETSKSELVPDLMTSKITKSPLRVVREDDEKRTNENNLQSSAPKTEFDDVLCVSRK